MSSEVMNGKVSHVKYGSDFVHAASPIGDASAMAKRQLYSFRLNDREVIYKSGTLLSLSDGDRVSVAGKMKDGVFHAAALRNLTTQASHCPPTGGIVWSAWVIIVAGIPAIGLFGVGFFMIGFGIWMLMRVAAVKKAHRLVSTTT